MPTSRPGSEPVEFWVDGSRRDGAVEEFYTLSSELGRSATHTTGGWGGGLTLGWVHMDPHVTPFRSRMISVSDEQQDVEGLTVVKWP